MSEKYRDKTRLYKVYHIRAIGNQDLSTGYVGITRRTLAYRLGQHFYSPRPVGDVLRELGKDAVEIVEIARLPKDDALALEFHLRPALNMGWNALAGGNQATVKCPKCGVPLPKRKTGTHCEACAKSRFEAGNRPFNYGLGERYELTAPDGSIHVPDAFTVFCRERDLIPQNLRQVAKGKRHHHHGWVARRL